MATYWLGWQVHQIPSALSEQHLHFPFILSLRFALPPPSLRPTQLLRRQLGQPPKEPSFTSNPLGRKPRFSTYQIGKRACSLLQASVQSHGEQSPRSLAWHEEFSSVWSTEFSISHALLGEPNNLVNETTFSFWFAPYTVPLSHFPFAYISYLSSLYV